MSDMVEKIANSKVITKAYDDLIHPAFAELGDFAVNLVKAARIPLLPIDIMAFGYDRLKHFIQTSLDRVPEDSRIMPYTPIVGPIFEGIKYQEEGTLLYKMFSELLTASIDKNRINSAHPAFPNLIKQLSQDEAMILFYLKQKNFKTERTMDLDKQANRFCNMKIINDEFPNDKLNFPQHMEVYIEHLYSLNLAQNIKIDEKPIYSETETETDIVATGAFYVEPRPRQIGTRIFAEKSLTSFGKLFAESCISESDII